jgi:transcriptional regulator GlxA family with amidase domain
MAKNIGIILFENVQPMDVIGPWEVFTLWKDVAKYPLNLHLIAEKSGLVNCASNIRLEAQVDFDNCPPIDYLVMPGGVGRLQQIHNEKLITFIQQQAKSNEVIMSVCTGMFLLERAGLLDGHDATTYWRALPEAKKFDQINIVEQRVVKSGKIWISGGVTSGIDLALDFIAEIDGKETAGAVQLMLEYFPENKHYATYQSMDLIPPYNDKDTMKNRIIPEYIKPYLN